MSRHSGASAHAKSRLQHLARQWRPTPTSDQPMATPTDPWASVREDSAPPALASDPWPNDGEPPRTGVRLTGWTSASVRGLLAVVLAGVLLSAWWYWSGRPHEAVAAPVSMSVGAPVTGLVPTLASSPGSIGSGSVAPGSASAANDPSAVVVVHVVGQVKHPGLVTLRRGSRVDDAIHAAGGVTKPHAADSVNLARVLVDGEQVIVGFAAQAVAGVLGIGASPSAGALLNLNTADAAAFENLPGVGPVLAQRIVQWRTANGPFRSVDELSEVSGIGDSIMSQIRPLATV